MGSSNYISEEYINGLREASKASEELGREDDFSELDQHVRILGASLELAVLRDLVFIHYGVINPLLRVQSRILQHRILQYSASIDNAPKCSANLVYSCLDRYFDTDSVIDFLSGLDMQLVTPFREHDETSFVNRIQGCVEAVRNRLCGLCYLCGRLTDTCEEVSLKDMPWDDLKSERISQLKTGFLNFPTSSFNDRLLAEIVKDKYDLDTLSGVLSELNRIKMDGGDIQFLESLTISTRKLLEEITSNYGKYKGSLSPEEITVVDGILRRQMPLAVEDDGKMVDFQEMLGSLNRKMDMLLLNKYDSRLPLSAFKGAVGKPDNKASFVGVKGIGVHSDEDSLDVFKKVYRFLVKEGCIADTYENYSILLLRLTGKNCGCDADMKIAWKPISLPKTHDADQNGARRLYYFVSKIVVTGSGRDAKKLVQADEYFSVSGKKPSECLTSGGSSVAANRADEGFKHDVDELVAKI